MLRLLLEVVRAFYEELTPLKRLKVAGLIALMVISGVLEVFGIMSLLAYIVGLVALESAQPDGKAAMVLEMYQLVAGKPELLSFAIGAGVAVMGIFFFKNAFAISVDTQVQRFITEEHKQKAEGFYAVFIATPYANLIRTGAGVYEAALRRQYQVFTSVYNKLLGIVRDGIILLAFVVILLHFNAGLTVIVTVFLGSGIFIMHRISKRELYEASHAKQKARMSMQRVVHEGLHGILDARLHNMSDRYMRVYEDALQVLAQEDRREDIWQRMPRAVNEVFFALSIVTVAIYLILAEGQLTGILSSLVLFGFLGVRALPRIASISVALQAIFGLQEEFRLYRQDCARYPQSDLLTQPSAPRIHLRHALEVDAVEYAYPNAKKKIIKAVSLTVKRGQFVSICGESGSGKTTLMLLMMGILQPSAGRICVDGKDITHAPDGWYGSIGYVSQTPFILPRSIRENVAFGCDMDEVDDEAVWEALHTARIKEFVAALPKGLDTPMRDGGLAFSGGQRQRIMIARALYKKPDILFFDEATSALDAQTEREVSEAINSLAGDMTIVCVAHRLSTIRDSDVIHYMSGGAIQDSGRYAELYEKNASFRAMAGESEMEGDV